VILIDTHPLIWFSQGDRKLGSKTCRLIEESFAAGACVVSPMSFWEAAMLTDKRRVALGRAVIEWMNEVVRQGVRLAPLTPEIAIDAGQLPGDIHGDPSDRIIVATARALSCSLITADHQILAYGAAGHVATIDAKR
jgi:PIN domain nuclease of toxin-antitoxin system